MSILDGLRPSIADVQALEQMTGNEAWSLALDNFQKALTNPEPVMLRPIAAALHQSLDVGRFDLLPPQQQARWMAAAATVLAAAAGGDR